MDSVEEERPKNGSHPWILRIKGFIFTTILLCSSFFGAIFIIPPILPLIYFRPRLWRIIMDRLIGMWVVMPGALAQYLFGVETTIEGDQIDHTEPGLIIMNHRTRLDWLFFWNALFKMDPWLCSSEKISMKGILKFIPGAGWAMESNAFLFLDRQFESDKEKLDKMIEYYSRTGYSYQLLFFPEGTDKCPHATERSRQYAEKKGLVQYEELLFPRTTGFVHLVKTMRANDYIKYIYDVTIVFSENIVQNELDMVLRGETPSGVQYQVRKIGVEELPKSDEDIAKWLNDLWDEKEKKLKQYYSQLPGNRSFKDGLHQYQLTRTANFMQIFLVVMWIVTTIFWMMAFFKITFMMYFAVIAIIIFLTIGKIWGGIEWLAVRAFK